MNFSSYKIYLVRIVSYVKPFGAVIPYATPWCINHFHIILYVSRTIVRLWYHLFCCFGMCACVCCFFVCSSVVYLLQMCNAFFINAIELSNFQPSCTTWSFRPKHKQLGAFLFHVHRPICCNSLLYNEWNCEADTNVFPGPYVGMVETFVWTFIDAYMLNCVCVCVCSTFIYLYGKRKRTFLSCCVYKICALQVSQLFLFISKQNYYYSLGTALRKRTNDTTCECLRIFQRVRENGRKKNAHTRNIFFNKLEFAMKKHGMFAI